RRSCRHAGRAAGVGGNGGRRHPPDAGLPVRPPAPYRRGDLDRGPQRARCRAAARHERGRRPRRPAPGAAGPRHRPPPAPAMKTENLITALVADRARLRRSIAQRLVLALLAGGVVSLVLFLATLGLRQDFLAALATWRFDLKLVLVLVALGLAFGLCRALAQP